MQNNRLQKVSQASISITKLGVNRTANTVAEVFQSPNPCFGLLSKAANAKESFLALQKEIKLQIGMLWPHEGSQAIELISTAYARFVFYDKPDWKINDISLFFKCILRYQNEETKQYRKIDLTYLAYLTGLYEEEKSIERELYHKSLKPEVALTEEKSSKASQYVNELLSNMKADKPVVPKPPRLKTEAELLVEKWMKQFNDIRILQCTDQRFIFRFNRYMDLNEWLEHKQDQYKRIVDNQPK